MGTHVPVVGHSPDGMGRADVYSSFVSAHSGIEFM